jgi:integrase/recombinase XerD
MIGLFSGHMKGDFVMSGNEIRDVEIIGYHSLPWEVDALREWMASLRGRSGSQKTLRGYWDTFTDFARTLASAGFRLDDDTQDVARVAREWSERWGKGKPPSKATIALRLTVVSSFYRFARKRTKFDKANPIDLLDRPNVAGYEKARPLPFGTVSAALAKIDRSTPQGARDYALLLLGLRTGKRKSELAALSWSDLALEGAIITVTWPRLKGDKSAWTELSGEVSDALLAWLEMAYGHISPNAIIAPDAPVWISFARSLPKGRIERMTPSAIAYICQKRLGTSRVHRLRHTYARDLLASGASPTEIQALLGHSSLVTTDRYLPHLTPTRDPYAVKIAALYAEKGD